MHGEATAFSPPRTAFFFILIFVVIPIATVTAIPPVIEVIIVVVVVASTPTAIITSNGLLAALYGRVYGGFAGRSSLGVISITDEAYCIDVGVHRAPNFWRR